jgi:hypothetical protein
MAVWLVATLATVAACSKRANGDGEVGGGGGGAKVADPGIALPPPPIAAPTEGECDQALANMKDFMPDEVPGDEADKRHCLGMPRPVVLCLQTARSVDAVDRCVDSYAAHQGAPNEGHATAGEAACREAMDNVRRLVPDMKGDPAQLVKDCMSMASASEAQCLRAAKSKEELDKCDAVVD